MHFILKFFWKICYQNHWNISNYSFLLLLSTNSNKLPTNYKMKTLMGYWCYILLCTYYWLIMPQIWNESIDCHFILIYSNFARGNLCISSLSAFITLINYQCSFARFCAFTHKSEKHKTGFLRCLTRAQSFLVSVIQRLKKYFCITHLKYLYIIIVCAVAIT